MTTSTTPSVTPDQAAELADQAAPLDALLIDAALGPVRRFAPDLSTAKLGVALIRKPRTTARRLGTLVAETGRIAIGTSTLAPSRRDRRFADEAWTSNPLLRRIVQAYLAGAQTAGVHDGAAETVSLSPAPFADFSESVTPVIVCGVVSLVHAEQKVDMRIGSLNLIAAVSPASTVPAVP